MSTDPVEIMLVFLLSLALWLGLFFLMRMVMLWYYKINIRIEKQDEIIRLLKENNKLLERQLNSNKES
jgi:hypothetical protein